MLTPGVISEDLTGFFHAGQIATAIKGAASVARLESADVAQKRLEKARFDQAPVTDGERPVGWVATIGLTGHHTVRSAMIRLENCTIVSAESPIASVLGLILEHKFVFVADKRGISGFIVQSDLDRHAVRSYFYLLISGIEMLLSEIVKSAIPEWQIAKAIRSNMKKRYERACLVNQETSPAEYLYIDELIELFRQTSYVSDPDFWNESLTNLLLEVKSFRNTVMHATRSIAASDDLQLAANLPGWASDVANQLRGIAASLNGKTGDD
jgi:hypothetical protein